MAQGAADADDTAKAILALSLMDRHADCREMVNTFKVKRGYFCTFPGERNPSFSTNCNVLQALLNIKDPQTYEDPICKTSTYLCDTWWNSDVSDKFVSRYHPQG